MNLPELKKLLKAGEWNDVEFKEARTDVPKPAYEAVLAFANTHSGYIIFGVSQSGDACEITGVDKPDKVQGAFLSVLHADGKVNHDVEITEQKLTVDGKVVLTFHIAENYRTRKPVYLDGDIRRTFLRRGGCNFKAQPQEIERLLRDATQDRWDGQPFDRVPLKDVFHPGSLKWKAVIKFFRDGVQFCLNSFLASDVFGDDSRLWEPGKKEVRNPSIATALRRIAMCEQAGTGLRMIREEWKKLGRPTPICRNDRSQKSFEFFLPEPDLVFPTDLVGGEDEPYKSPYKSDDTVIQLLTFLVDKELSSAEIQKAMKLKHRATFQQNYLNPALEAELIERTIPEKPNSRLQKYRLTEKGRQHITRHTP